MTDSRYRLLVRSLYQVQTDALVQLAASGSMGPTDWRTINALVDRQLIDKSASGFEATKLGKLVALYFAQEGGNKERRRPQAQPG